MYVTAKLVSELVILSVWICVLVCGECSVHRYFCCLLMCFSMVCLMLAGFHFATVVLGFDCTCLMACGYMLTCNQITGLTPGHSHWHNEYSIMTVGHYTKVVNARKILWTVHCLSKGCLYWVLF